LAVLEGLDPDRKRILLEFLYESNLIWADKPVISVLNANLHHADLRGADLRGVENLTRDQIRRAGGDEYTLLPLHLKPSMMVTISEEKWPPWWRRWFRG
jgi:Pentapeptide repeats (8 copies)